ncbi:MAG: hypothetical protein A2Z08_07790 [Deltaproteobacteria bacterium RBG_16_54_11]|nr:MAG: hypothetical protein A2Z08_07790 [Deltaproteobacteria bacterium RBG_16_54_11]
MEHNPYNFLSPLPSRTMAESRGGERTKVRGKVTVISTGQRATGQGVTFGFGLTPTLSRQRERG